MVRWFVVANDDGEVMVAIVVDTFFDLWMCTELSLLNTTFARVPPATSKSSTRVIFSNYLHV